MKNQPDMETLVNLSKLFEVSLDYLTGVSYIRNPYIIETTAASYEGDEWAEEQAAIDAFIEMVRSQKRNT